ncbi:unnamed protein product, partial [Didymodactylos carnosus]
DVQSDSSSDDIAGHSFGFAVMPSNMLKTMDENIVDSKIVLPSSPFVNRDAASTKSSDSSENIFSALLTATDASDLDNVYNNNDEGRNARPPMKNSSDINDFAFNLNSPCSSPAFSPKRSHLTSDSSYSLSKEKIPTTRRKRVKSSPTNSIKNRNLPFSREYCTTTIGNLKLTWPPYGIKDAFYAGEYFSVFHTCSLDTGLFVLYHAYKAGTDDFRQLFEIDTLEIYAFLHRTFQLVESNGWNSARLYWLTGKKLLKEKTKDGKYDLKSTMDEVVFKFVKPMQTFPIQSKCTCTACPKPLREHTSMEISLTKVNKKFLHFIPALVADREPPCGVNLGSVEPMDYPATYMVDERYPVIDQETNETRLE